MIKLTTTDKPNKKAAFNIVYSARNEGCNLTDLEMDQLLNYFAPNRPSKPKNSNEWVAKACANTKEVRFYLQYMHVADGIAYGTDGNRLHWASTELADGFYDPSTLLPCEVDAKFPDCKRVIPTGLSGLDFETGGEHMGVSRKDGKDFRYVTLKQATVQESYWLQALADDPNAMYSDEPFKVRGCNKFGEFVIMGCRI